MFQWRDPTGLELFILFHIIALIGYGYFKLIFWLLSYVKVSIGVG